MSRKVTLSKSSALTGPEPRRDSSGSQAAQQRSEERYRLPSETAGRLLAAEDPQVIIDQLCARAMAYLDCHVFFNFLADPERAACP
jgi:hypothetical protein